MLRETVAWMNECVCLFTCVLLVCLVCLSCVLGCSALTFPTRSCLSAGAHQAGWVNGVSWKTPAIPAPVLAVVSARAQWWRGPPGSPAAVPGASEVKGSLEGS